MVPVKTSIGNRHFLYSFLSTSLLFSTRLSFSSLYGVAGNESNRQPLVQLLLCPTGEAEMAAISIILKCLPSRYLRIDLLSLTSSPHPYTAYRVDDNSSTPDYKLGIPRSEACVCARFCLLEARHWRFGTQETNASVLTILSELLLILFETCCASALPPTVNANNTSRKARRWPSVQDGPKMGRECVYLD
ncbi:hypothetical protein BU24DRAFT_426316, partial [Aaosphaeria arxii CBS 175.79]